jgi:hypothetical protein
MATTEKDLMIDLPYRDATLHIEERVPGSVEVHVQTVAEVNSALDDAIERVQGAALHHRTGILVTRVGPGSYVVRAHPAVPYGMVRQRYE